MEHQDQENPGETKTERRSAKPESPEERTIAPPIEREHETSTGIVEEDERREHEQR